MIEVWPETCGRCRRPLDPDMQAFARDIRPAGRVICWDCAMGLLEGMDLAGVADAIGDGAAEPQEKERMQ